MADVLKSLLEKQNTGKSNWYDIANAWSKSNNRSTKSLRNILLAQTIWGMKEFTMQNNVNKNLKELDRERIFDLGGMNQKWEGYQGLISDEKAYKADSNYFKKQALTKYNETHPSFDAKTALESEIAERNKEIEAYAAALLKNHQDKTQGNFDVKMNKEQFFQPFNDYYNQRAEEINAPKNRSLVHAGWDKITNGRKEIDPTAPTLADRRNIATRGTMGYILDPDEIKSADEISLFRDPNKYAMTVSEVRGSILNLRLGDDLKKDIINNLDNSKTYTAEGLQDHIAISITDFSPTVAKLEASFKSYDTLNEIDDSNRPKDGDDGYVDYVRRRNVFAMQENRLGNQSMLQFQSLLFEYTDALKNGADATTLKAYETQISKYTKDDISTSIMNTIATMKADPIFMERHADDIEKAGGQTKFFLLFADNLRDILEGINEGN